MSSHLFAIVDDREPMPLELKHLVGDIRFGDLLRRHRRHLDELVAAASGANDVTVLRNDEEAEQLVRRIETADSGTLWLRLPAVIAPLDMGQLNFLVRKLHYALEPLFLGPMFEDEAPMALFRSDAIALLAAKSGSERRSCILQFADKAATASHQLEFVDLRQANVLRRFLSGATEPRAFNLLSEDSGVFIKSSTDIAKIRAEHGYFELAPPEMRRFLLPTFGYEEQDGRASYKMEHLCIPDASLQFVLGTFSETDFSHLLDQFFAFIETREHVNFGVEKVRAKGHEQIIQKMHDRLNAFLTTETGTRIESYLVAGGIKGGLLGLEGRVVPFIEQALSSHNADYLAFSHGDPCLSNILFDSRIGLMRLIDPRGAVVREDALMHPLYDIAKLSHSICGGYDFVNNGLFSIEINSSLGLELRRHHGGTPGWIKSKFRNHLEAESWKYKEVRAVEASLFLSMLPLHLDYESKLIGFSLIAQEIIEELEGSYD